MAKNTGRGSRRTNPQPRDWRHMLVPSEQAVAWWDEGSRDPGRYFVKQSWRVRLANRIRRVIASAVSRRTRPERGTAR